MSLEASIPPPVLWAQRSSRVLLTFNVECDKPDIKFEQKQLSFKGVCAPDQKTYEILIPLYAEIDTEKSSYVNKGRYIDVVLVKENIEAPFWPALTSDKKKHHWLKVDFDKWQDEDETDEEFNNMNDMFASKLGDFDDEDKGDTSSVEDDEPCDIAVKE